MGLDASPLAYTAGGFCKGKVVLEPTEKHARAPRQRTGAVIAFLANGKPERQGRVPPRRIEPDASRGGAPPIGNLPRCVLGDEPEGAEGCQAAARRRLDDGGGARRHEPAAAAPVVEPRRGTACHHLALGQASKRHPLQGQVGDVR